MNKHPELELEVGQVEEVEFNLDKYIALAHMQPPRGITLCGLVEENWQQWLDIVEKAAWLRTWVSSPLRVSGSVEGIAQAVFTSAVWGYGIDRWSPYSKKGSKASMDALIKLQGGRASLGTRTLVWDTQLQKSCGAFVPVEYAALDRWLEPMWCGNS